MSCVGAEAIYIHAENLWIVAIDLQQKKEAGNCGPFGVCYMASESTSLLRLSVTLVTSNLLKLS